MQIWKIINIIQESTAFLNAKGIENPRLNAEQLLAHLLQLSRVDLYVQFDRPLNKKERDDYKVLLKRRAGHEPLQYILGSTEFMSLPFHVTPAVLIPRPETEIIVEKILRTTKNQTLDILDIGTGSGCIAISLAHYSSDYKITAWDKSEEAIQIAKENGNLNQVNERIDWQICDILNWTPNKDSAKFNLIVSNPPYVTEQEWKQLDPELKDHEPQIALSDGGDGLLFYRTISQKAKNLLKPNGLLYFEVGDKQANLVKEIMSADGFQDIEIYKDLNHIPRTVKGIIR